MRNNFGNDFVDFVAERDGFELIKTCRVIHLWDEGYEGGIERGMDLSVSS